jgi:uncharacterized membrane protein (DUF106 family)
MVRIEQRTRELIEEDPEMQAAVETILDRSDAGQIDWVDVRDELTSGQWGRLIEKGILVDGDSGFELADRDAVEAAMSEDVDSTGGTDTSDSEVEGTEWTKWDKGAALVTVALFAGYTWGPMRNLIGNTMNIVLAPLEGILPFYGVVMVLALATGLYSTILQANLMNTEKMAEYQNRVKDLQERKKQAKEADDDQALEEINQEQMEAMSDQMGMFKEQFRPMVWIMFLTIPVFLWMYWGIGIGGASHFDLQPLVLPIVGQRDWTQGVVGPVQAWIVWYFLCSMAFTQIIRKGLNIDMTPSTS